MNEAIASQLSKAGMNDLATDVGKPQGLAKVRQRIVLNLADSRQSPTWVHTAAKILGVDS